MLSRLITAFFANAVAFLLSAYLLDNFYLGGKLPAFLALVAVFTLINLVIRPLIKLILTPLILITFGFFTLVINAGILYVVDIYSAHISIDGLATLFYATVIITLTNLILSGPQKLLQRRPSL